MDKDGPETMREAVTRAIEDALRAIESDARLSELTGDEVQTLTDAAIRTVLERLREVTPAMEQAFYRSHCGPSASPSPDECWQDMLDAAAREVW